MAITLLAMCQRALREKGQFNVPSTIVGSTDPTTVRLLTLADRTGRWIANYTTWQVMIQTYTFATVNGTETYALPSDFVSFIDLTQWDRTNYTPLRGPQSAAAWEVIRSGNVASASQLMSVWRVAGNLFAIRPAPTTVRTIAYQYLGKNYILASGDSSATKEYFTVDTDTCVWSDDLMVLGIKERMEAVALGIEWAPSAEYQSFLDGAVSSDGGKAVITFGQPQWLQGIMGSGNLPESNFG